jgi:oxygen-independent coproporphyrinogen III oxidase
MKGLYIHIPFCVRKCSYCDFYSLPNRQSSLADYVQVLLREAHEYSPSLLRRDLKGELAFQTLYVGGGTPSLLGPKNLQTLITGLSRLVSSPSRGEDEGEGVQKKGAGPKGEGLHLVESTLEVNPESATPEFLQTAKNLGFNRLSFGVQSLSDAELLSVGRIHSAAQAVAAIKLAQKTGFQNISADLIIGLPGQTWHSLHNSLEALTALGLPHLSVYCLSLENGTPLALNPPNDLPSDDFQAELYEKTRTFLTGAGFVHYEISNYARPGFECKHNLNYWRGGEYLGLGPAAASHLDGKRFKNNNDLDAYLQNPTGQVEYVETLSPKSKAAEEAMLRLRLLEEGLNTDELTPKFGPANTAEIIARLDKMAREGLLLKTGVTYRLEPAYILTSNSIFSRVLGG